MRAGAVLLFGLGVVGVVGVVGACGGGSVTRRAPNGGDPGLVTHDQLAPDDGDGALPGYGKPELERALTTERGSEATAERKLAELESQGADDASRIARDDLAVRRRFIASLEACAVSGKTCPPRLDDPAWSFEIDPVGPPKDPKLETPLRFDLADWQLVAAELHGRACACRTLACVDSLGVAIDQLETRPIQEVQGDEVASASITHARECLFRLRGKVLARAPHDEP